jgi:hypothetical protein
VGNDKGFNGSVKTLSPDFYNDFAIVSYLREERIACRLSVVDGQKALQFNSTDIEIKPLFSGTNQNGYSIIIPSAKVTNKPPRHLWNEWPG